MLSWGFSISKIDCCLGWILSNVFTARVAGNTIWKPCRLGRNNAPSRYRLGSKHHETNAVSRQKHPVKLSRALSWIYWYQRNQLNKPIVRFTAFYGVWLIWLTTWQAWVFGSDWILFDCGVQRLSRGSYCAQQDQTVGDLEAYQTNITFLPFLILRERLNLETRHLAG